MRLHLDRYFTLAARGLMLAAAVAFVQQGAIIIVSQAAAFGGSMPEPAVALSGKVHIHDQLAGHVHMHRGHNAPGQVHNTADLDDDDADAGKTLFWSLGCTFAVLSAMEAHSVSFEVVSAIRAHPLDRLDGVEPDGPNRPPSTPSIA